MGRVTNFFLILIYIFFFLIFPSQLQDVKIVENTRVICYVLLCYDHK
jgi:hypothetical protein